MSTETILRITEIGSDGYGGYEIITDKQSIKLIIDTIQDCCERTGYFWCNDAPQDFVGAQVLDVYLTDIALNDATMKESGLKEKYFEGGIMFVNINTSIGLLQFVAYNEHNGYYGHEAKVTCSQLDHSEVL